MRCPPLRPTFMALLTLALAGCGPAQNRTITFSADGKQAAVEHGRDGIFIVEEDGSLTKVFQPGPDVLVASTPLFSPTDKRLIFTTAEPVKKPDRPPAPHDPDPAGDLYFPESVVYTCWLRDAPRDGGAPEPKPLFTALCDHPAYVASNLAVRWRPDGRAILYVRQTGEHRHELFAYNLETRTSELVFPHPGQSLVFDWTPDHARLWCVLGGSRESQPDAGMWVGVPGADDWWRVPESDALAQAGLNVDLPAWTADGKRFAFVTGKQTGPKETMEYTLRIGDAALAHRPDRRRGAPVLPRPALGAGRPAARRRDRLRGRRRSRDRAGRLARCYHRRHGRPIGHAAAGAIVRRLGFHRRSPGLRRPGPLPLCRRRGLGLPVSGGPAGARRPAHPGQGRRGAARGFRRDAADLPPLVADGTEAVAVGHVRSALSFGRRPVRLKPATGRSRRDLRRGDGGDELESRQRPREDSGRQLLPSQARLR